MQKINLTASHPIPNDNGTINLYEAIGLTAAIREDQLSLAKTVMQPHSAATRHYHRHSKEIYIFLSGSAELGVDENIFGVSTGDVVLIEPNERHAVLTRAEPVSFLALTVPAYSPNDFLVD
jgi:mannose-6-phosphate isomerase-like protein (cupin superfamily)